MRSESSETYATPDGQLEDVQHLQPVRARIGGVWKPIDNTLEQRSDGTVGPKAAAVGMAFSGGGSEPLVTLERTGKKLSFSWPSALPAPTLNGDTATYADVLPEVDLKIRAATDGFSELLVVKTAEAAKDPALANLELGVDSPGLDVAATASGGLEAKDAQVGGVVFQAPQPFMWDSSEAPAVAAPSAAAKKSARTVSDAAGGGESGPGDAAKVAPIGVVVSGGGDKLQLTPDQGMLTEDTTTFPVYIDPQTYTSKVGEWTMVSKYWASAPQWRFNGDADAGMGYCGWDYCAPQDTKRLFYQLPTSKFAGKSILSATFIAKETWSASCDGRAVELWRTKGFNSGTTWNSSKDNWLEKLDTRDVAKGFSSSCPGGDVEFDATAGVKYAASHNSSTTSFGLRATNEDDKYGWKRFAKGVSLRVVYNQPPKQIAMSQLSMSPGATCKSSADKVSVRTLPKIQATGVKDPDGDQVSVEWQLWWDTGSGMQAQWTSAKMTPKASGKDFSTQLTETLSNGKKIPKNKTIAWYARAVDYDQGKYYSYSPWSGAGSATGCNFVWDTTVPPGPGMNSGEYPAADDSNPMDPTYDGVGQYGTFTLSTTDKSVTKYWYGVNEEPSAVNEVKTSNGADRTVSFRPTRSGVNFLYAKAFDSAGNASEPVSYMFRVKAGQPVRAQWNLDDPTGSTQAAGHGGDRVLDAYGSPTLGVPGAVDGAVSFDGVDDYLQSDIPTVATSTGFSVAAWVKPDVVPDHAAVIAAQPGNNSPGFELYYSSAYDRWAFNQYESDTTGATPVRVMQATAGGVKAGSWVHLAGTFSSASHELSLYVDGEPAGTVTYNDAWEARRGLQIGAGSYGGSPGSFFPGTIDDVRIYDKPLAAADVARLHAKQPIGPGRPARAVFPLDEKATDDSGSPTTQVAGHADVEPAVLKGGAKAGENGRDGVALSLDGIDDYATTASPHLNNQRGFSVVAWAKLTKTKPTHAAIIATQTGKEKPGFELYYSPTYGWAFNEYSEDSAAGVPIRAAQGNAAMAAGGEWTQVVGSYDAVTDDLRLYVQGKWVATTKSDSPFYGGGAVQIGAGNYAGVPGSYFPGEISDVQMYDRALSAPEIADIFERQVSVEGRWRLDGASGPPASSPDDLVREDHTPHPMALGSGAGIDASGTSNPIGEGGLLLNGSSTGYAATTNSPVDTSSSFTVSAWVTAPSRPTKTVTVLSMAGVNTNGFAVRYVPDANDPENHGRWQLSVSDSDSVSPKTATAESDNFQNNSSWNHLAVVYDASEGQIRLYVDGALIPTLCTDDDDDGTPNTPECAESVPWNSSVVPFVAAEGLQLGRAKTGTSTWGEYWSGEVDDVWVLQGAASDTQISRLSSGDDVDTVPGP